MTGTELPNLYAKLGPQVQKQQLPPEALARPSEPQKQPVDISEMLKPYTVKSGDSLISIARAHGLKNYDDILALSRYINSNNGVDTISKKKRTLIHVGDILYVPKEGAQAMIESELETVRAYAKAHEYNNKINSGKINLLKEQVEERIFEKGPITLSSENFLGGFIAEQKREITPVLPPIIDEKNRKDVACIHMLRRLDYLRVNRGDRSAREKAYVLKPDIDAWEVQDELVKIGYKQSFHGLAETTDSVLASKSGVPVSKEKRPKYDALVHELGEHLDKDGKPGSYVSISYRFSNFRAKGGREHPNTHQMMYLGTDTIEFPAYKFPKVQNGKVVTIPKEEALKKNISVSSVDFFENFVRARADTKAHLTKKGKNITMDGMQRYAGLIQMKVNGVPVDFAEELKKSEKERVKISPEDLVAISGPMMLDGFHQLEKNGEHNPKMDSRVRFFSEALVSGLMFPTELHEPTEKSVYGREAPSTLGKKLKVIGMYSLGPKEEFGKVLKERIQSEFERATFEKLEEKYPNRSTDTKEESEYRGEQTRLLSEFYRKQIQALQLAGYLETEDKINYLAANVNRPIPYFDVTGADFKKMYSEYISLRKQDSSKRAEKLAKQRDFVSFQVFPGDTYESMFDRVSERAKFAGNSRPEYEKLGEIAFLDTPMKRTFLKECFRTFFDTYGWKFADAYGFPEMKSITDKEKKLNLLMTGRIKAGSEFIFPLNILSKVYDTTQEMYKFREIKVKPIDEEIIQLTGKGERIKKLMRAVLVRETYIPEGSDGRRRFTKDHFGSANSLTDFQIRFLDRLSSWKKEGGAEWPKPKDLLEAASFFKTPQFSQMTEAFSGEQKKKINKDLEGINTILPIIEKARTEPISNEEYTILRKTLLPIVRLDDGTGANIVGKVIGGILLRRKLYAHATKIEGVLREAKFDVDSILARPEGREKYTETLLLENNLGEKDVFLYGITENYMIRLLNTLSLVEGHGKTYKAKDIKERLKWGIVPTGQKVLGTDVFVGHMTHLADLMALNQDISTKNNQIRQDMGNEIMMQDAEKMGETTRRMKVRQEIHNTAIQILEIAQSGKYSGLELDAKIAKVVFDFFRSSELRSALVEIAKEPGCTPEMRAVLLDDILPRKEERTGFLWSYTDEKKDKATPGKHEGYLEFGVRVATKKLSDLL